MIGPGLAIQGSRWSFPCENRLEEVRGELRELASLALGEDDVTGELLPANRSAAIVSPFEALSTYGLSICPGSPVSTIFVPSPERVMIVLTSCGVRFCASSTTMNCCGSDRPRM